MKLIFGLILLLSLCSCREEKPLRGEELCRQLDELPWEKRHIKIDSIIRLSKELSPAEHHAVVLHAIQGYSSYVYDTIATHYLQYLVTLPFPEIESKAAGFLLLRQYAFGQISELSHNSKVISALLFNMENRQRLTPEEKCRFLTLKAGIYRSVFQEYSAAASIINEAKDIAHQHKLTGQYLRDMHVVMMQTYLQLDSTQAITLNLELLTMLGSQPQDSITRQALYKILAILYTKQKDYHRAWYYTQQLNPRPKYLYEQTADLYIGMDSIPQLLAWLEKERANVPKGYPQIKKHRRESAVQTFLARFTYIEARAYRHMGDTARYGQLLHASIQHLDQVTAAPSPQDKLQEAYIHLLWKQGKHSEAIRRLEKLCTYITTYTGSLFHMPNYGAWKTVELNMSRLRLLAGYYRETGRTADALRQSRLCDSLQNEHNHARLIAKQNNMITRMYTDDLNRNLELQRANYEQERQKLTFIAILLSLAIIAAAAFALLYRRRQKELNAIYARQKEIEQLETTLASAQNPALREDLPADKQLYLRLEKQMRDEQLYLNPDFSRDDLCRLAGSNRMYVSTSINKYAEMNLNQWINKARVNHAIRLIRSGETNLQVLAEASGFSSSTSFFRNFRQFTLLSPKQYIEREKKQPVGITS